MKNISNNNLSIRLGKHSSWLNRLEKKYPDVYNRMFSYHTSYSMSIRLYRKDLKRKIELIKSLSELDKDMYTKIAIETFSKRTYLSGLRGIENLFNYKEDLITINVQTHRNINNMYDNYMNAVNLHFKLVKEYDEAEI